MNLGKHQITVGTQSDYRAFKNGFTQNYPGAWVFNSLNDFKFNVLATKDYMNNYNGSIQGFDVRKYNPVDYGFAPTVTGITNSAATGNQYYSQKCEWFVYDRYGQKCSRQNVFCCNICLEIPSPALDSNAEELGFSAGSTGGRLLLFASYMANPGKHTATNFGLIYQRYRPFRYSYCYAGDANGDSQPANDLLYIPRNFSEVKDHLTADGFDSQKEAWNAMKV